MKTVTPALDNSLKDQPFDTSLSLGLLPMAQSSCPSPEHLQSRIKTPLWITNWETAASARANVIETNQNADQVCSMLPKSTITPNMKHIHPLWTGHRIKDFHLSDADGEAIIPCQLVIPNSWSICLAVKAIILYKGNYVKPFATSQNYQCCLINVKPFSGYSLMS